MIILYLVEQEIIFKHSFISSYIFLNVSLKCNNIVREFWQAKWITNYLWNYDWVMNYYNLLIALKNRKEVARLRI